jgi:peptidyl-prolyl cis-trans isomerase B (cyclophilin B)
MMTRDGVRIRVTAVAAILLLIVMAFALAGCAEKNDATEKDGRDNTDTTDTTEDAEEIEVANTKPVVEITMQDGGKIDIELDRTVAPITVENFLKLVNEGFYDGLTFHRIIPNFMIQGGDPEGTGVGGADETIEGEFKSNGVENSISHERGVISMARSQDPNSASSQFFITNADSIFLDGEYASFGHVTSGMDVVDEISSVETAAGDAPTTPVVIATIKQIE